MINNEILQGLVRWGRSLNVLILLLLAIFYQFVAKNIISFEVLSILYSLVAVGLLVHLGISLTFFWWQKRPYLWLATFIFDFVWIGVFQHLLQLTASLPLLMNIFVVVLASLALGRRWGLVAAGFGSVQISIVVFLSSSVPSLSSAFLSMVQMGTLAAVSALTGTLAALLADQGISLHSLQNLNALILQNLPSGLLTVHPHGQIVKANQKALQLLDMEDLGGKLVQDIFQNGPNWNTIFDQANPVRFEYTLRGGTEQSLLDVRVLPQGEPTDRTFLIVFDDLTERRRWENQRRQSEKMAAVGKLAAGIAHEIRNPLAGISGSLELLSDQALTADDKKLRQIALKEIARLNNLITEFLDFAKPVELNLQKVDLSQLLEEQISLWASDPRFQDVKMHTQIEAGVFILGVRDKLIQVILNLAINAADAMKGMGSKELQIRLQQSLDQGAVVLEIQDQGPGISPEVIQRIFEPFFTTKAKGTGLGLALVHRIVEAHQAEIEVQSPEGGGALFRLVFPLAKRSLL